MAKLTQLALALTPLRLAAASSKRRNSDLQGNNRVPRNRRLRLYRLIERTQGTIAEIETELGRRGIAIAGPPRRHGKAGPFRHNEPPRLRLTPYRPLGSLYTGDCAALVPAGKDLDPLARVLAHATVTRARTCLLPHKRKGIVRLVGLQRARSARWALVDHILKPDAPVSYFRHGNL